MKLRSLYLLLTLMMAAALVVAAQNRGQGQGPGYDPSAETTITGTITDINTLDAMCHSGTHIVLKTDSGTKEVALGPTNFLNDQKLELKKGDQVQVVGATANTRRGQMFVARQITMGGKAVTLRDEKGVPAWPRGMCK